MAGGCNTFAELLIMSNSESDQTPLEQRFHYILIDRNGPVAEFETWADAFHCMSTRQLEGSSIVRCEGPVGELSRPIAGLNERPGLGVAGTAGARAQTGRSTPDQPVPEVTKKVLVISEDVSTLLAMAQIVKVAGHGVAIGRSASEAVQTIGLERPDLIIVDVDPVAGTAEDGWDGFHMVDWLRCHYPDHRAKYIIVSGADPEKSKPSSVGADACAVVGKPIVKELLLTEIGRAIGGQSPSQRSEATSGLMDL